MFAASDAEKRKGRKTIEFWDVDLIDYDGIVKDAKMSVREAMERSLNGSKIILRFNKKLQAVEDGAGLLSGILGALGSGYSKFFICEKSWEKVQGKDMVYDDCIKNLNNHPEGISREHWRWFIDYRNDPATKVKCKQNTLNPKKQLYTHTGGSKSLARAREEEPPVDRAQMEEAQRMLFELQAEGTAEKLRRKAVEDKVATEKLKKKVIEDEIAAEKTKRQALESVLSFVVQQQGGELPLDIAGRMNSLDGHSGK
ncbi:hypothetical protein AHAS_Ahas19G0205400 [Arachis hypogaea]|uniref:Uncharacterized protein n=1 Tax=Arachis hypogaea TaxID=3818 RepID=A0A444XP93_ARAHY|nr:hypothetical protein Ahy_B09g097475 [Arachis hypogaea]